MLGQPLYDQFGLPVATGGFELPGQSYPYEEKKPVADNTVVARLEKVFQLAGPKILPGARVQLKQLITPQNLLIMAGIIVVWVVSHGFFIGEMVDIAIAAVGWFSIGLAVFDGLDELFEFARLTIPENGDLEKASDHLAKAIEVLGITLVLTFLFKNRPTGAKVDTVSTARPGAKYTIEDPPPTTGWFRQKPTITDTPALRPGQGECSWWGDIKVGLGGSANDRSLALLHEKVHRFFVPKLYIFRNIRVYMRAGNYLNSSLYRWFEEALSETIAKVAIDGATLKNIFGGIGFPTANGYLYLIRSGANKAKFGDWGGNGILTEGAGLVTTIVAAGIAFELWFKEGVPADVLQDIKQYGTKSKYILPLEPYLNPVLNNLPKF